MGCTGERGAGCKASIHPQELLWHICSKGCAGYPEHLPGMRERLKQGMGAVVQLPGYFLQTARLGSILLAQGGWVHAIRCLWAVSCNWLPLAVALILVILRLLASFFGVGHYEL